MALSGCSNRCQLMYVTDTSGRRYLVDSGSEVSLLPPGPSPPPPIQTPVLRAANGSTIAVYDAGRDVRVDLGLGRVYEFKFLVAAVTTAIIGADFLREFGLVLDMQKRRLVDSTTYLTTLAAFRTPCKHPDVAHVSHVPSTDRDGAGFENIRSTEAFKNLCVPPSGFPAVTVPGIEHRIITKGNPVFARPRRLMPAKLAAAKQELEYLLEQGIVVPSSSPWSSPIHLVEKDGGKSYRMVGCYERLNAITVPDRYPVPHLQTFADRLSGATVFSTVDLARAFAQIPLHAADQKKTAITTPFGLFEYRRLPFGLSNAAQSFQRLMDTVLRGMSNVYVYIDDILVFSPDAEQHHRDLDELFRRLGAAGLVIKPGKCTFGQPSVHFLGLEVSSLGILPLPDKVADLLAMPPPRDAAECKRYLGMVNHFHRFIPNLATLLQPLHDVSNRNQRAFEWKDAQSTAFESSKRALADASRLAFPRSDAPTKLVADASDKAVGAVIMQWQRGTWVPLAYHSRKLQGAQLRWCTGDKELYALFSAVKRFRHLLEGRPGLQLWTDHKPLTYAFTSTTERSPRVQRQLAFLSEFSTDIRHISGFDNAVSDCLSRPPIASVTAAFHCSSSELHGESQQCLDLQRLAREQRRCAEVADLASSPTLRVQRRVVEGAPDGLLVDVSTGIDRPLVPVCMQREVYSRFHDLHHPSARATRRLISERFVFARVSSKVAAWSKHCLHCQQCKVARHQRTSLERPPLPSGRFESLHVDIVGPLLEADGYRYVFTIVDRFTRYVEAVPMPDATATTCARPLLDWVARFGMCSTITSDRGRQFVSDLWAELWTLLGVHRTTTLAFMPQQNGLAERAHRQLKAALTAALQDNRSWPLALPVVLMGMRSAFKPDIGASSAELVLGEKMRLPGEFFSESQPTPANELVRQLAQSFADLRPVPTAWHRRYDAERPFVSPSLRTATHVFVRVDAHRPPLTPPYRGPYPVLRREDKFFVIENRGKEDTVAVDRLKPAHLERHVQTPLVPDGAQRAAPSADSPAASTPGPPPSPLSASADPTVSVPPRPTRVVWSRRARPVRPPRRFR